MDETVKTSETLTDFYKKIGFDDAKTCSSCQFGRIDSGYHIGRCSKNVFNNEQLVIDSWNTCRFHTKKSH